MDLGTVTVEDFAPHVGEPFVLPDGGTLTLIAAESLAASPHAPRPPFRLQFRELGASVVREQAIQTLSHATLGSAAIFVVPIGQDADGVDYEAIFA